VEVIKSFIKQAYRKGKIPIVTILPTDDDLAKYIDKGRWTYQPLLDTLNDQEIEVLNVGAGMISGPDGRDPCLFFKDCNGHYNELGYARVARIVYDYLMMSILKDL